MKLKKGPKIILMFITLILIALAIFAIIGKYKIKKEPIKEVKILNSIEKYDYKLRDNKSKIYKKKFRELEKILNEKDVNYKNYAKKITEMFIIDFYSLNDRVSKTDIGGIDFVHPNALDNFLLKAQDTYYKYIESNIYGERKQKLPIVNEITINNIDEIKYTYSNKEYDSYKISTSWTYNSKEFDSYQTYASLIFIKDDKTKKLFLVELK